MTSRKHSRRLLLPLLTLATAAVGLAPVGQAIHGTNVCDSTTGLCFRIVVVDFLGDFVPSSALNPTAELHVATGLLRVSTGVEYVETLFVAASLTSPGLPPDWSAYNQNVGGAGTAFTPTAVTSTPVDLSLNPLSPGDATGEVWSTRYQVWLGSQKVIDVPGVACTC